MTTPLYGPQWTVGGWVGNVIDDAGVEWIVSQEDGWFSSPAIRADLGDLPGGDGSYDADPLYSARTVTLTGTAIGPDPTTAAVARLRFSSLLEAGRGGTLSCTEDGFTLTALVRPSGPVKIAQVGAQAFDFQIQVTAPDPRKYGPVTELTVGLPSGGSGLIFPVVFPANFGAASGGGISPANDGTVETWPIIRITGPAVNPRILNPDTGDMLVFAMTLAAGETLDIDTAARSVLYQLSASRRSITRATGRWLPIAPGGAQLSWGSDVYDPAASMTVAVRSAWI